MVALIEEELDPHLQGNGKGRGGKHLLIRLERGESISIFKSLTHFLILVLEHRSWSALSSENYVTLLGARSANPNARISPLPQLPLCIADLPQRG